ncbi:unnamed protein product [Closterium sp. Yama58-4]|nr:unnamed protein product [Closterium sp. Yama58-4]
MKVARGLVPTDGAGAAGQQRKGGRILAAETYAHDAPLPGYLDHIPRRQALATSTLLLLPFSLSTLVAAAILSLSTRAGALAVLLLTPMSLLSPPFISLLPSALLSLFTSALVHHLLLSALMSLFPSSPILPSALSSLFTSALLFCSPTTQFPAPLSTHFPAPVALEFPHRVLNFLFHPIYPNPYSSPACGRTTVTIRSQYLGPYDLHNNIYNMTFYNGCAYNVTSPLRVYQCANFGNVWEGSLDNPAPNPTQYQTGDIFVQSSMGYCEMRMNRGATGTVQMFPGETVNILYAWTSDWCPCASELRFSNGNSYSMADVSECQAAAVI